MTGGLVKLSAGKKRHKVYGTIILQPYITESCGFQQNVLKEILYVTKVSV